VRKTRAVSVRTVNIGAEVWKLNLQNYDQKYLSMAMYNISTSDPETLREK
jgi:hypothetical protein